MSIFFHHYKELSALERLTRWRRLIRLLTSNPQRTEILDDKGRIRGKGNGRNNTYYLGRFPYDDYRSLRTYDKLKYVPPNGKILLCNIVIPFNVKSYSHQIIIHTYFIFRPDGSFPTVYARCNYPLLLRRDPADKEKNYYILMEK
jgi:hypothetical protein